MRIWCIHENVTFFWSCHTSWSDVEEFESWCPTYILIMWVNFDFLLCYSFIKESANIWPPLWSSGHSSWLQIQRSRFDSRRYQIFWEVVGLERRPLSLVTITAELLESKVAVPGLENLTSPTSGGRSIDVFRLRTKVAEFTQNYRVFGLFYRPVF
jgi:hypothetical protein